MSTKKGKVTVVLDAQAGSCGKGKFIGYLACKDKPVAAIDNFMSNAGHTFVTDDGVRIMTQHLPTSMVNPRVALMIGPGAAITPKILITEIIKYKDIIGNRPVMVHPRAMVILEKHCEHEKELIRSGSTFKGCGAAQADKLMRVPGVQLFGSWWNEDNVMDTVNWLYTDNGSQSDIEYLCKHVLDTVRIYNTAMALNGIIDSAGDVMVEGSQGFDLDINYGLNYPHTTSRQCHAGQLVADCGISPMLVTDIMMIMRPYPIRISNQTNIGLEISSGDYDGAPEISWDEVARRCGAPSDVQFGEMTTVTKKVRRVFEMNWDRLEFAAEINRPTQIALNFAQYIDYDAYGCTQWTALPNKVKKFILQVEQHIGCPVTLIGTGPCNNHIIDIRPIDTRPNL
jgi:adenylosuccinate synthase